MHFHRIYAIFIRHIFLFRGSPIRFLNIFTWIFIDVLLWGFITKYLNEVGGSFQFTPVFLGAILLWGFLSQVHRGFILASLEDVWMRNYLNLFTSPLRVHEYIAGLVLSAAATTTIAMIAILVAAKAIFGFSFFMFGAFLVPAIVNLSLFGIALGIFASAIVLRVGPSGEWLAWPIPAIIAPFVGVFYSIQVLPEWMRTVAYIFPPTHVFEGLRGLISAGRFEAGALLFSIALSIVYLAVSYGIFVYVYRVALRRGLISRFSAESA